MIRIKPVIEESDIGALQHGGLPEDAQRIGGESADALMIKALPIAVALCGAVHALLFLKTFLNQARVIHLAAFACGFALGFPLLIVHEWLHAIVYPKDADVLIGKLKGRFAFVALAFYPLRRRRFILMCLAPFVLGIVPLAVFLVSPADQLALNGFMFGLSIMGMVSPYPDVHNIVLLEGVHPHGNMILSPVKAEIVLTCPCPIVTETDRMAGDHKAAHAQVEMTVSRPKGPVRLSDHTHRQ